MKGAGCQDKNLDMENIFFLQELFMMVNGVKIISMARELCFMKMETNIKENGSMGKNLATEPMSIRIVKNMRVNGNKTKNKDSVH